MTKNKQTNRTTNAAGRTFRRELLGVLLLLGPLGCEQDERACTAMACAEQGLTINLDVPKRAAIYHIVVSGDNGTSEPNELVSCTMSVEASGARTTQCTPEQGPSELDSSINVRDSTPKRVHVVVTEGTTTVADESLTPTYVDKEINGPGCGTCTYAAVTITVVE